MFVRHALLNLFLIGLVGPGGPLFAQAPASEDPLAARIQAVSRQAKSANTATGYTEIITECDDLLTENLQKDSHRQFLQKLLAWALDRRGVARMELTEQFRQVGSDTQADLIQDQALSDFARAIENDATRWQTPMHRGTLLATLERYPAAIADFTAVLELKPQATAAWFNRAELKYQLGEYASALTDYEQTLELDPRDLQALNGRGHCYLAMNKLSQAMADYDTLVEKSPRDAWAWANRAEAHQATQQWTQARDDLQQACQLQSNGEITRRLAWLLATCPLESVCDGQAALQMARQAIEISGESLVNLDTLAAAHAAAGEFDRARDVYARVIALQDTQDEASAIKQAAYQNNERYQQPFDR